MCATISIRCNSPEQKKFLNEAWALLVESRGELTRKVDALQYLTDQYELAYKDIRYREAPEKVEALIREANCKYIQWEIYKEDKELKEGFVCYESFSQKKKFNIIGTNHDLVLRRCNLCKTGKIDRIEQQVQKQLRKKNIKGLLDLRDILINLQIEGGIAQIYICKGELLENKKIIVSTDGIHLHCPLEPEEKDVQVKSHCYNQITPWTMEPPCQYLIDPFVNVKIEPSEKASEAIERIALEFQEGITEQEAKTIDAEVIEPEGQPEEEKEE